jgi:ribosomal silencing factor RsfS
MTPKQLALALTKTLDEKKGGDIKVLETAKLTTWRIIS